MTPYQRHRNRWGECEKCNLCKRRKHVVLARGRVPCSILFLGEAPGSSEDVLGVPFIGPAGKLLDRIIERGLDGQWDYALTNLVACIPLDKDGKKMGEPDEECIEACAPRLKEIVHLCHPQLIVCVGKLATKHISKWPRCTDTCSWLIYYVHIIHPAAILRMDISQRGLAVQRSIVAISDAVDKIA